MPPAKTIHRLAVCLALSKKMSNLRLLWSLEKFAERHLDILNLRSLFILNENFSDFENDLEVFLSSDLLSKELHTNLCFIAEKLKHLKSIASRSTSHEYKQFFESFADVFMLYFGEVNDTSFIVQSVELAADIINISSDINKHIDENVFEIQKQRVYRRLFNCSSSTSENNYFDYVAVADLNSLLNLQDNKNNFTILQEKRQALLRSNNIFEKNLKSVIVSLLDDCCLDSRNIKNLKSTADFFKEFADTVLEIYTNNQAFNKIIKDQKALSVKILQKKYKQCYNDHEIYNSKIEKDVSALVGKYIDWRFPSAYFLPASEQFARKIIAGDPIYVFHDSTEVYQQILKQLHPASHSKVHYYRHSDIERFPDEAIGMFFAWSMLVQTELATSEKTLEILSNKLTPGGTILTVFNDVETETGSELADHNQRYPMTLADLQQAVAQYGLAIDAHSRHDDLGCTVVVLKKHGAVPELNLVNKLGLIINDADSELQRKEEEKRFKNQKLAQQKLEMLLSENTVSDIVTKFHNIVKEFEIHPDNRYEFLEQYFKNHNQSLSVKQQDLGTAHPTTIKLLIKVAKILLLNNDKKSARQLLNRHKKEISRSSKINPQIKEIFLNWHHYLNNI